MLKSSQTPIKCSSQKSSKELSPKFNPEWSSSVKSMSMSDAETPSVERIKTTKEIKEEQDNKMLKKSTTSSTASDMLSGD